MGGSKILLSFNEDFIKNYNENSDEGSFFWSWCSIIWKIKIGKAEKHVANLHDKTEYVKKNIRVQNAWPKPYIYLNTDLRKKKQKMALKKIFLSWWIMQFWEKLWEM